MDLGLRAQVHTVRAQNVGQRALPRVRLCDPGREVDDCTPDRVRRGQGRTLYFGARRSFVALMSLTALFMSVRKASVWLLDRPVPQL